MKKIYHILSIAGTDPVGGAGIQSDLKTFSALGAYGITIVTSLVAQNTRGVQLVYPISADFVAMQMESVFSDVRIDSAKIGMVGQASIIHVIAEKLKKYTVPWLILDTVMVSKSGDLLLDKNAVSSLRNLLLPLASVITPNLPEAAILLGCTPAINENQMRQQGRSLLKLGCQVVIMKGGHLASNSSPDWLISSDYELRLESMRISTQHTHGTGCTLSAALAALRPRYNNWQQTLQAAKAWLQQALLHADDLNIGKGIGPVHHFYDKW
ncbi:Hydroxymethylpyrimidine/phosphomethylpyrimidine kinase [Candidatus Gullanella endobia]|uniref:hydroxymethylpyrimidine kinase n=1 Tax=Candidatus Gullanella endobia TaxID=1070130 RepID=A0A143WRR3_9ENTR|nr:bifunctional hydroxymethylpyrimidine kinase/phosphomethylpyrimidine kinase [Candidatus Gullanella endobia]CUX96217.1 Hydroxymethylpyrimidine/phosphomethylpyrimidine kinase [Candidatus Gullanella endobia]